jgi:SNF2 family DNA or RNA helicase
VNDAFDNAATDREALAKFSKPKLTRIKGQWAVTGQLDAAHVEFIPGLHIIADGVTGPVDAVAVVCKRVGLPLPPKPSISRTVLKLPRDLRDYQATGVRFMRTVLDQRNAVIIADEMGLGKTRQCIETARLYPGRKMVVCPASVRETWREELGKWLPQAAIAVMGPPSDGAYYSDWLHAETADWVIIGMSSTMEQAFQTAFPNDAPVVAIFDEAHNYSGRDAKRGKIAYELSMESQYKIAGSGTPIDDRPRSAWRLLSILFGRRFGNVHDFDLAYCGGVKNEWGGIDAKGATRGDELRLRLSYVMIRRETREVLKELPPLTRQVVWLDPNEKAQKFFQRAIAMGGGAQKTQDALEATLEGKMPEAMRLAAQAKRFLLLTWMKDHAKKMHQQLNEDGTPCELITGDIPQMRRQQLIKLAESKQHGIVATLDSVMEGLNMQGAARVGIMHSISYMPRKMAQGEKRIHRLGQTAGVLWYYLAMRESMDELVLRTVLSKLDAMHTILGGDRSLRGDLGANEGGAGTDEAALLREIYANLGDSVGESLGDDDDE